MLPNTCNGLELPLYARQSVTVAAAGSMSSLIACSCAPLPANGHSFSHFGTWQLVAVTYFCINMELVRSASLASLAKDAPPLPASGCFRPSMYKCMEFSTRTCVCRPRLRSLRAFSWSMSFPWYSVTSSFLSKLLAAQRPLPASARA